MDTEQRSQTWGWLKSPAFLVFCGFLIIIVFFLFTEHSAHAFGILPFLLFPLSDTAHANARKAWRTWRW